VRPVPDPASHSRTLDTQTPPTTTFARAPPAPPAHPTISLTMADDSTSKKSKTVVGSQVGSGDHDEWLRRVQGAYVSSHTLHTHTHTHTHTHAHTHPLPVADRPYHAVRTSFATHALVYDVCVVAGMVPMQCIAPLLTHEFKQTDSRTTQHKLRPHIIVRAGTHHGHQRWSRVRDTMPSASHALGWRTCTRRKPWLM
jgi:hypothetical protein